MCQRGSSAESRARTVKAKFQSNIGSERAKVSQRDFPQTFPFDQSLAISGSPWFDLLLSLAPSGSLWLKLTLSLALIGSLWPSLALTVSVAPISSVALAWLAKLLLLDQSLVVIMLM